MTNPRMILLAAAALLLIGAALVAPFAAAPALGAQLNTPVPPLNALTVTALGGLPATAIPTSAATANPFSFAATATLAADPNATHVLPSLSGVGGTAVNGSVAIRSGPGVQYPRISFLRAGRSIDIVGYNGWETGRQCSPDFENDLDMWVEVQFGERRGWIARCVLVIRGDISRLRISTDVYDAAG